MPGADAGESRRGRRVLGGRHLYLCTADRPDLVDFLTACIRGGVDVVQLRDKQLDARPTLARAAEALAVCADFGVPFILNDRPDLALACSADGVHVGQDDAPPQLARLILGEDAIVGLSTHSRAEWDAALGDELLSCVDYLSAGPVSATPTKPGRPGTGLEYVRYVSSTPAGGPGGVPWFVTGGVTPAAIPEMVAAGATRFVVVRYLTESDDPYLSALRLRAAIGEATGH